MFFLCAAGCLWLSFRAGGALPDEPRWLAMLETAVLLILGIGILRAAEWARIVSGWLAIVFTARLSIEFVMHLVRRPDEPSLRIESFAVVLVLALLWAVMATYLLRSSTRLLFAHIRAGSGRRPAPSN